MPNIPRDILANQTFKLPSFNTGYFPPIHCNDFSFQILMQTVAQHKIAHCTQTEKLNIRLIVCPPSSIRFKYVFFLYKCYHTTLKNKFRLFNVIFSFFLSKRSKTKISVIVPINAVLRIRLRNAQLFLNIQNELPTRRFMSHGVMKYGRNIFAFEFVVAQLADRP